MSRRKVGEVSGRVGELEAYVRARVPLLYVVTWEEQRALRELEQVAIRLRAKCWVWSEARGLRNVALEGAGRSKERPQEREDRKLREPLAVLGRIERDLQREGGAEEPGLYVLMDLHPHLENAVVRRHVRDLGQALITSQRTVVLVSPRLVLPQELQKEVVVVDLPLPTREELEAHVTSLGKRLGAKSLKLSRVERESLTRSAQGMTLHELEQTLSLAMVRHGKVDGRAVPLVLDEKQQIVRKSTALEYVRWDEGFEAVGGLESLKAFLEARGDAFSQEARAYGLPEPRGVCLIGVQGCGKSLSAKAVARFYQLPLLRMDVGRVFAGVVGRSEENVRGALKLAESLAPCVLWIDELEKSLSGLQSSHSSDAGTAARVISTIITWLQERAGQGVYVVATANSIERLPPELLRKGRFDEIFFVDLPQEAERAEVLAIHLRKRRREPEDFDLAEVARRTEGFSGAELEEVVVAGLYTAFAERRALRTEDVLAAVSETVPLSQTMSESVAQIRAWAEGRARRASPVRGEGGSRART